MESKNQNAVEITTTDTLQNILDKMSVKLDVTKAKAARKELAKIGAANEKLDDAVAVAADQINRLLKASDSNIRTACYIAGAFRLAETWKTQVDENGKPYKSENAFLRAILPNYAVSTVSLYCDVGATVYIPAANGELDDLPDVAGLSPSNAKFLLNSIKNAEKRKLLPAALEEARKENGGRLTQKAVTGAVKRLSAKEERIQDKSNGNIADELSGGGISKTVSKLVSFTYNGDDNASGDLTSIVLERDVKDFMSLLLKASKDADTALAVCESLYVIAKKAN